MQSSRLIVQQQRYRPSDSNDHCWGLYRYTSEWYDKNSQKCSWHTIIWRQCVVCYSTTNIMADQRVVINIW